MTSLPSGTGAGNRRPIGYFVHHQGRGHAERCAALLAALPLDRPVTVFCARPSALPTLPAHVQCVELPSLFEARGDEPASLNRLAAPDTVHCAPLGWSGIREAMATLANWFERANPALLVSDVSAEVAQLARLCSVPHVCILQHGYRDDPGHRAAFDGAAGMLAPYDRTLAQRDWPDALLAKTCFAAGLGVNAATTVRTEARKRLQIDADATVHLIVSGGGGDGFASAALGVAARSFPAVRWHSIGQVRTSWHATEPDNLVHHGWVRNADDYIAAADLVISTAGNTVCHQVLAAGKPWLVVPEWCYFDEQVCKGVALNDNGLAHVLPALPSHARGWQEAVAAALLKHDPDKQRACVHREADLVAARWLDRLCIELWQEPERMPRSDAAAPQALPVDTRPGQGISVLTLARGRDTHLKNLLIGLSRQSLTPDELVIGVMQPTRYIDLPAVDFPVRQILIEGDELPLSRARNVVARSATCDALIFLDVDCIPGASLVADYADGLQQHAGLLMGEVRYLPKGCASDGWKEQTLQREAVLHDHRAAAPDSGVERCTDYRCFWSLNFAIRRATFDLAGGFDEGYTGYGGEDTDFGRTLFERGIPINWMQGAHAYHQYHDQRMPPVAHLEAVVRNAEHFESKWGHRTMDHWLHAFALLGLLEDSATGLRLTGATADAALLAALHTPGQPYASTAHAIDYLEREIAERHQRKHRVPAPAAWFDRKRFVHRPKVPVSAPPDRGGRTSSASCRQRLRIALLAHIRHPIRQPFAGGMEAHTWHLARGLSARGHQVTLFASADSDASVPLIATVDEHYEATLPWRTHRAGPVLDAHQTQAFSRAMQSICAGDYDVVHNNTLHPLPIRHAAEHHLAMLTSLHVPPFQNLRDAVHDTSTPGLHFTVPSDRQRIAWSDGAPDRLHPHVVPNGIDTRAWPYSDRGDGSAVWAGRIGPNKAPHLAAQAAQRTGMALTLIGPIEDRPYFEQRLAPLLGGSISHIGHLDGAQLAARFGRASVLLFTPMWEEPFGLVAAEAMACGTPVAALDNGAAREVIGDAGSMASGDDAAALAEAIQQALRVPRQLPRARVERLFSHDRMIDAYERLYPLCIAGAQQCTVARCAPDAPIRRTSASTRAPARRDEMTT